MNSNICTINDIMTFSEASEIWAVDTSTLRHAVNSSRFFKGETRKSKGTWLVTRQAMSRLFGDICTTNIYTIGYEGLSIDGFIDLLISSSIDCIIDVRAYPLSRKKGFSKSQLSEHLDCVNIEYRSIKPLGAPKSIRNKLAANKDYVEFFDSYRSWLDAQRDCFDEVRDEIVNNTKSNYCLLCFEKKHNECHRSVIADKLLQSSSAISDIINIGE